MAYLLLLVLSAVLVGAVKVEVDWCAIPCTSLGDRGAVCNERKCACSTGYGNPVSGAGNTAYVCTGGGQDFSFHFGVVVEATARSGKYSPKMRGEVESALSVTLENARVGVLQGTPRLVGFAGMVRATFSAVADMVATRDMVPGEAFSEIHTVRMVVGGRDCDGNKGLKMLTGCMPMPNTETSTVWCSKEAGCTQWGGVDGGECNLGVCVACGEGFARPTVGEQMGFVCTPNGRTDLEANGVAVFEWSGVQTYERDLPAFLAETLGVAQVGKEWGRTVRAPVPHTTSLWSVAIPFTTTVEQLLNASRMLSSVRGAVMKSRFASFGHLDDVRLVADGRGDCTLPNTRIAVNMLGSCTAVKCNDGYINGDGGCRSVHPEPPPTPPTHTPAPSTNTPSGQVTPTRAPSPVPSLKTSDDDDSGLSSGAIAGIVVGSVAGAALIIGALVVLRRSSGPSDERGDAKHERSISHH